MVCVWGSLVPRLVRGWSLGTRLVYDSLILHAHVRMCDFFSAGDLRAVVHRNCPENQSSTGGKDHKSM